MSAEREEMVNARDAWHTNMLLDVQHLNVDYFAADGVVHAVRDVSFTLKRGEILGLAGESGCGKSTLAYAVARLLRPPATITGGKVLYYPQIREQTGRRQGWLSKPALDSMVDEQGAVDLLQLSPQQLQRFRWDELSIVFQSAMNALNPVLTIGDQLVDILREHRPAMNASARKQRAIELMQMVGIAPDRLRSYPHELSGGMRQRAVIALALALQPDLIIMDEPTTALDVVVQRDILQLIISLCRELHTALIFITHDLSLLIELADTITIMYAGKVVEQATNQEIYEHPRHPYSYGLLNSFPTLHGPRHLMTGIPGSPPDLRALPAGCAFEPRCPFALEACQQQRPPLLPAEAVTPRQVVACHLYNRTLRPEAPGTQDLADGYTAAHKDRLKESGAR